ncbi:MAG: MoaD/ThiS family protein [Deltaproteobacteria bacterium]|jgi:molybdopterin converting factor small subunit|nr:MoaD/ThiS family protein [Deltaproteobacteria bacterium]
MFGPKEYITINVKLYSGLDHQAKINHYDPDAGIELAIAKGARLKKVFKLVGLSAHESIAGFINGKKAGPGERLKDGDVVYFMKPVSGG